MTHRNMGKNRTFQMLAFGLLTIAATLMASSSAFAQYNVGSSAVGGVMVNTDGVMSNATTVERQQLYQDIAKSLTPAAEGLADQTQMRKISLRKLNDTIREQTEAGKPLSDAVLFLGGLQSIRYVVADPENNDIVLIGPAEGWVASKAGTFVGETTGRPVLLLDDLVTVLRASNTMRPEVITCSIDPTQQGLLQLQQLTSQRRLLGTPQQTAAAYREALGPQKISLSGVPGSSHFARTLVAADYRMKRIGMAFDRSPIAELPSFMGMTGGGQLQPRWWMAPQFETLLHDESRLTWDLHGASVKTMYETDYHDAQGVRHATGSRNVQAERWADLMTKHYDKLSKADPVFGELRNCMDLAVVAAVIFNEGMIQKTDCQLTTILESEQFKPLEFAAPTKVATDSTVIKKSSSWVIGCGGVEINPWTIVDNGQLSETLEVDATVEGDSWWAN